MGCQLTTSLNVLKDRTKRRAETG